MRILVSETMDPNGAMVRWLSPDAELLGHVVLRFPTQEALPLLGPDGLAAAFLAIARAFQPTLVVVHPPYDHLDRATLDALGETGAAVVGFAFDEPLFAGPRARPTTRAAFLSAARAFDRYAVTDSRAALALAEAAVASRVVRFAASPEPFEDVADPPVDVAGRAVLVGRAYPKRVALVRALGPRVPVDLFGHGWRDDDFGPSVRVHGPLTRAQMNAAYRRAGVVITTGDWEDVPVPMVKYRLLEVAFAGGAQLAQASPDLPTYFRPDEVPSWSDPGALADLARTVLARPALRRSLALKAHARALAEHRWKVRLAELVADLPLARADGGDDAPPAWCALIAMIAHDAERRGAAPLAAALFEAWHARAPNATAHAGLLRLALADRRAPPPWAGAATPGPERTAAGLYAALPTAAIGLGQGRVGYLDPTPERVAFELAALVEVGHLDTARALLASARMDDPDLVVSVAAILEPTGGPAAAPIWKDLYHRALTAAPTQRLDLRESHRAIWQAYLGPDAPTVDALAALKKDGTRSSGGAPERSRMQ